MQTIEVNGRTVDEALQTALNELKVDKDKVTVEVIDEASRGFLSFIGVKQARIKVTVKRNAAEDARAFLDDVLKAMGINAELKIKEEKEALFINISGDKMGLVIGYRGETLDSLQYLTSLVVNKNNKDEYIRVSLDTENYRQKREETLIRVAQKTAYKVKKSGRPYKLEPMNPYERRIIHSALKDYNDISTYSEGEEPFRRVVVSVKR
ncbi:MAG: protein jag [Clostridium sp.]|nr:protein jag [Clostridium sp.]